jgi:hypothetical protein
MTPPIFLLFLVLQPQNWGENQIKAGGSSFFFVDSERKEWGGHWFSSCAVTSPINCARMCVLTHKRKTETEVVTW